MKCISVFMTQKSGFHKYLDDKNLKNLFYSVVFHVAM